MMKKIKSNKGASMAIVMIAVLVITLACLTLFTTITTTLNETGQEQNREQARILASSLGQIVNEQISVTDGGSSEILNYIRQNLGNGWTWYNEDEPMNNKKSNATRTFRLNGIGNQLGENVKDVSVSMYWTSDSTSEIEKDYSGRMLYVTTSVTVSGVGGDQTSKSIITYQYVKDENKKGDDAWTIVPFGGLE